LGDCALAKVKRRKKVSGGAIQVRCLVAWLSCG